MDLKLIVTDTDLTQEELTEGAMLVGSRRAISYAFFRLIDELFHALPFAAGWMYNFCQWANRYEMEER